MIFLGELDATRSKNYIYLIFNFEESKKTTKSAHRRMMKRQHLANRETKTNGVNKRSNIRIGSKARRINGIDNGRVKCMGEWRRELRSKW